MLKELQDYPQVLLVVKEPKELKELREPRVESKVLRVHKVHKVLKEELVLLEVPKERRVLKERKATKEQQVLLVYLKGHKGHKDPRVIEEHREPLDYQQVPPVGKVFKVLRAVLEHQDCPRGLWDLKVHRVLVAKLVQQEE